MLSGSSSACMYLWPHSTLGWPVHTRTRCFGRVCPHGSDSQERSLREDIYVESRHYGIGTKRAIRSILLAQVRDPQLPSCPPLQYSNGTGFYFFLAHCSCGSCPISPQPVFAPRLAPWSPLSAPPTEGDFLTCPLMHTGPTTRHCSLTHRAGS